MRPEAISIYRKLFTHFGPQYWWPAETPFEVAVGAILTQNTSWSNVEKAIRNLKERNLLTPRKMRELSLRRLAECIRPSGYYNIKAKRLKYFLSFLFKAYQGNMRKMSGAKGEILRRQLLSINGIGSETADSVLLYALNKPVFVIDAYTRRIFSRHKLLREDASYDEAQKFFMQNLRNEVKLFNEYHALIVKLAKEHCLKRRPKCEGCPLK